MSTDPEEREELDTNSMLLDGFMHFYKGEVKGSAGLDSGVDYSSLTNSKAPVVSRDEGVVEAAMISLMEIREDFISRFSSIQGKLAQHAFQDAIVKIEGSLNTLGVEVDPFDPLTLFSGLGQVSNLINANTVVENTKKNYSLYDISAIDARQFKNRPAIFVKISGKDDNGDFEVNGIVVPEKDFSGNEAIDYVRHEGKGLFTIKANTSGEWVDVTDGFHIAFEHPEAQ